MKFTDLDICNLAIDRVSGDRIDSLQEESPLGAYCKVNYPHTREFILSKYRWTFANAVVPLTRVDPAEDPTQARPLAHKYAKPSDLVGAVHAWRETADISQSRTRPYVMEMADHFWSEAQPLFAEYTALRPESAWPAWFRELVVTAFAANVAGFCGMSTKSRDLQQQAWGTPGADGEGGLFASAKAEDARLSPPRDVFSPFDNGPLVDARFGFGTRPFGAFR